MPETQHFDQFAQNYQDVLTRQLQASGLPANYFAAQKARIILAEAPPQAGGDPWRLLDVGCGNGLLEALILGELAEGSRRPDAGAIKIRMDGIDVSPECVEEARRRELPNSYFRAYDGQNLPFEDHSFDAVVFCVVMHHVPPETRAPLLKECRRVLKPGKTVHIFEHNPLNPLARLIVRRCPFDRDAILLRAGECARLLRRSGFEVTSCRFLNFFPNRGFFRKLMSLEGRLGRVPLGAQYAIHAVRTE